MRILKIIITGLSLILITYGCSSGPSTTGGVGWIPIFTDVHMLNVNAVEESTFGVGDSASFHIDAEDDDMNMTTVWVTEVLLTTTETTALISGPNAFALPKQTSQVMAYTNIDPITISGPTGNYRIDFQLEDATGNKSKVISIIYSVQISTPTF